MPWAAIFISSLFRVCRSAQAAFPSAHLAPRLGCTRCCPLLACTLCCPQRVRRTSALTSHGSLGSILSAGDWDLVLVLDLVLTWSSLGLCEL